MSEFSKEQFNEVVREYIDFVNEQVGAYMSALMGYKHIVTINSGNHVGRLCFRRMRAEHTRAKQLRWVLSCLVCRAE